MLGYTERRAIARANVVNTTEIRSTSGFCLERKMTLTEAFAGLPDP